MMEIIESIGNGFWTVLEEMVEDLEELGLDVADYNDEYVVVVDEDNEEAILYLGHANKTIWIDRVREM